MAFHSVGVWSVAELDGLVLLCEFDLLWHGAGIPFVTTLD
jgi:hypothetical protein